MQSAEDKDKKIAALEAEAQAAAASLEKASEQEAETGRKVIDLTQALKSVESQLLAFSGEDSVSFCTVALKPLLEYASTQAMCMNA